MVVQKEIDHSVILHRLICIKKHVGIHYLAGTNPATTANTISEQQMIMQVI